MKIEISLGRRSGSPQPRATMEEVSSEVSGLARSMTPVEEAAAVEISISDRPDDGPDTVSVDGDPMAPLALAIKDRIPEADWDAEQHAATDPLRARTLKELCTVLESMTPEDLEHTAMDDLPTFGGAEVEDTTCGIYSWDDEGLLLQRPEGWKIVPRAEHFRVSFDNGQTRRLFCEFDHASVTQATLDAALPLMDDVARELAHLSLDGDVSPGEFIAAYLRFAPADLVIG